MPTTQEQMVLQISADTANVRRAIKQLGGDIGTLMKQNEEMMKRLGELSTRTTNTMINNSRRASAESRRAAAAAMQDMNEVSSFAANNARNLTFQINDVLSALASGQGMRGVAQQFGQIAQSFSGTSVMQTLRGLLSWSNLITIGLTLAGTAAAYFFTEMEDGAEKAKEEMEKALAAQREILDALRKAQGLKGLDVETTPLQQFIALRNAIKEVAKVMGELPSKAKELERAILSVPKDTFEGQTYTIQRLESALSELSQGITNKNPDFEQFARSMHAIELDPAVPMDIRILAGELSELASQGAISMDIVREIQKVLSGEAKAAELAAEKTKKYNEALDALDKIATPALKGVEAILEQHKIALQNASNAAEVYVAWLLKTKALTELNVQGIAELAEITTSDLEGYAAKVAQAETGGKNIQNLAGGKAFGIFQFMPDTFVDAVRKINSEMSALTREQILEQRWNIDLQKKAFEVFTRENAAYLESHGEKVNDATLYLAHFLGKSRAVEVLRGGGATQAEIASNKFLAGMSSQDIVNWAAKKMGGAAAKISVQDEQDALKLDEERARINGEITEAFDKQAYAKEKAIVLAEELARLEKERREEGKALTAEDRAEAERLAEAAGQLEGRRVGAEKSKTAEGRMQQLRDENDLLRQQTEQLGLTAEAAEAMLTVQERQTAMNEASNEVLKIQQDLKKNDIILTEAQKAAMLEVAQANEILRAAQEKQKDTNKEATKAQEDFNKQIAGIAKGAISGFISDLRNGVDAGQAFSNMLDRIIDGLIDMALNALFAGDALGGIGGGAGGGGGIFGAIGKLLGFEKGGIVGQDGEPVAIKARDLRKFKHARHFQSGGWASGIPALLHPGELVIPRNVVQQGRRGGAYVDNSSTSLGDVKIDMAGTGLVAADSASAKAFGENVQRIIQVELVRESRPGGLLRKVPG